MIVKQGFVRNIIEVTVGFKNLENIELRYLTIVITIIEIEGHLIHHILFHEDLINYFLAIDFKLDWVV